MLRDKTNYYSLFDWDSWMAFIPMRFGKEQQQTSGVPLVLLSMPPKLYRKTEK